MKIEHGANFSALCTNGQCTKIFRCRKYSEYFVSVYYHEHENILTTKFSHIVVDCAICTFGVQCIS